MNIEPAKVVSDYERNLSRGGTVACFGVLKLLNELLDPENNPQEEWNRKLRDRLYVVLAGGEKLFLGQNYSFDDRKPRDDLYIITQKETDLDEDRIQLIRKALRMLPSAPVATSKPKNLRLIFKFPTVNSLNPPTVMSPAVTLRRPL